MIITKDECKRYIRTTDSDNDDLIEALIPIAQEDLCDYLNNHFEDTRVYYSSGDLSFVRGDPDTITDAKEEFVRRRFAAGMDVYIKGESSNQGIYELATVTAGTLTLTSVNQLISMAYNDTEFVPTWHTISRIVWPNPVKLVVARMVAHLIARYQPGGELSENRDGVVVSYDRRMSYPREITQMAQKYRRPEFV